MMRKYTFNTDFFKIIDNEEKAYWLGFISADGYLNKKGNTLGICLNEKDKNHLEKFKKSIEYTGEIKSRKGKYSIDYKETNKVTLEIYSTELSKDLNRLGLDYQKSYSLKAMSIPLTLINHFIRGYFDGDGCVFEYSKKISTYNCGFTFTGTKEFLTYVNDNLPEKCKNLIFDKRTTSSYTLYLASIKRFLITKEFLYKNATIYLDRKYDKCNNIEQTIIKRGSETRV